MKRVSFKDTGIRESISSNHIVYKDALEMAEAKKQSESSAAFDNVKKIKPMSMET